MIRNALNALRRKGNRAEFLDLEEAINIIKAHFLELQESASPAELENVRKIIELLLRTKNINGFNRNNQTALSLAIEYNNPLILRTLLLAGANPKIANNIDKLFLLRASYVGHIAIVKALLEQGADVNLRDSNGCMPLLLAAFKGHTEIARMLLDHGANPNIANNHNETPLVFAAARGYTDITAMLLERGVEVDAVNNKGYTALGLAAAEGYADIVAILLDHGANINNNENKDRKTALHNAAGRGYTEIVKILLERGAEVDEVNNKGYTALTLAAKRGYIDIVKMLLEHGANTNSRDMDNNTVLYHATLGGHRDIVTTLLAYNADPNLMNSEGRSTLMWAALQNEKLGIFDIFFDPSEEKKKNKLISIAKAIEILKLAYSDRDYGSKVNIVHPLLIEMVLRTDFPYMRELQGKYLTEAAKAISNNMFTIVNTLGEAAIEKKFKIIKAPYSNHAAYFVIEYLNNFPSKLIYVDGNCIFSQKRGRTYGATIFEINTRKLAYKNLCSPEAFEEYLWQFIFEEDRKNPLHYKESLLNFLSIVTDYTVTTAISEENQLILTSKQNRGNCVLKSFDILLRLVAQLLYPNIMIFDGSNIAARMTYKFYTQQRVDICLELLINFLEEEQKIREETIQNYNIKEYKAPLLFDEIINTLKIAEVKANTKAGKKYIEEDREGNKIHLARKRKIQKIIVAENNLLLQPSMLKKEAELSLQAPCPAPYIEDIITLTPEKTESQYV